MSASGQAGLPKRKNGAQGASGRVMIQPAGCPFRDGRQALFLCPRARQPDPDAAPCRCIAGKVGGKINKIYIFAHFYAIY
ncbi:MAG: hypothetical protein IKQ10_06415 [Oscillospiraceae bacterium]|nr:hypothetical protein [Oscillospiraceae bacterium]